MKKIKIGIVILTSIMLAGLVLGTVVLAEPLFGEKSFDKANYVQDEIIVKFKGDIEPFRVIKVPEGTVGEKIKEYLKKVDIEYAEPNYIAYALWVPNDPYYKYQWHLDNPIYGGIQMEEAWNISTGNTSVIVAIIDTGVAYENYRESWWKRYYQAPDLVNTCFVPGYDFVYNDNHPNDDNSHGTHVAGTVAQSTNNGVGVAGVAFNSCLMPVKVLDRYGSGTYANVAKGIRFAADNGAKVINLSLGGSDSSTTLKEAIAYAYSKGATIVAAAGNDGSSNIVYPAAYNDYAIAVGATRYDQTLAYYSNYGPSLDLVAPGGDLNVDQNGDGYKDGVLQNTFSPNTKNTSDFGYWFFQGTSMAAPHVSGVAALVIANGNASTPDEVRAALQETAEDLGATGFDEIYGWGLIDSFAALNWAAGPACTVDTDCDDGLYCNGVETCVGGVCQAETSIDCSALSDQCNNGVCEETLDQCIAQPKANGTSCDDGLFCNTGETCQAGVCTGGSARNCDDSNPCTADSCDEVNDSCKNAAVTDGTVCDDGQFCTVNDVCTAGACEGAARDCSDAISCTVDNCDEVNNVCVNTPDNSYCSDGLFCNGEEICSLTLGCQVGIPVNCDDGNKCTIDSCDEGVDACVYVNVVDNTTCTSGICCSGTCTVPACSADADCDDVDACTIDTCANAGTCAAACSYEAITACISGDGCCPAGCTFETDANCPEIQAMHVVNIEMGITERWRGWYKAGTATITIVDASNNPVQGATVYGRWSGAASDSDSGVTDELGQVTFQSDYKWARSSLTFTICIKNVEKTDWTYDESANVETCDSITTDSSSNWSR